MCNCAVNWCDKLRFLHLYYINRKVKNTFQEFQTLEVSRKSRAIASAYERSRPL